MLKLVLNTNSQLIHKKGIENVDIQQSSYQQIETSVKSLQFQQYRLDYHIQ